MLKLVLLFLITLNISKVLGSCENSTDFNSYASFPDISSQIWILRAGLRSEKDFEPNPFNITMDQSI